MTGYDAQDMADQGAKQFREGYAHGLSKRLDVEALRTVAADIRSHCSPPNSDAEDQVSAHFALSWAERIEASIAAHDIQEKQG